MILPGGRERQTGQQKGSFEEGAGQFPEGNGAGRVCTWAVSPEGVVQAMGEVVRKVLFANVKSVTGLPSSSTTAWSGNKSH